MTKTNKTKVTRGKWAFVTKKEIHKVARAEGKKACKASD
jgi:hypothetical protein